MDEVTRRHRLCARCVTAARTALRARIVVRSAHVVLRFGKLLVTERELLGGVALTLEQDFPCTKASIADPRIECGHDDRLVC